MPAGDLLAADGQFELRALLQGTDTDFTVNRRAGGVQGLFGHTVKSRDLGLDHAAGEYPGTDYLGSKNITIPIQIKAATPALLEAKAVQLEAAWEPSKSTDLQLHFQWPGRGHIYVTGRPRGLTEIDGLHAAGWRVYMALFKAHDPTITTVP